MGSVVTTIFFAEVATYYDGAKDTHPQGGPTSTSSSTMMMAAAGAPGSTTRGPPSTPSSTAMVATARAPGSTPRGPAVDVFINYDGGRYLSSWQRHQGPAIDVWLKTWYLSPAFLLHDTYQGATMGNTTTADRTKFYRKIFLEKGLRTQEI
jgi:hypothetical protein